MDIDPSEDPSLHRLEASAPITGGLVIKSQSTSTFKVPKASLLGLDRLAAQKRKERADAKRLISFKDSEHDDKGGADDDNTPMRTPDASSQHTLNRQYREPQEETPTHSGGVSKEARDRLAERGEKDRRGIAYSSKDKKRSRRDEDDDYYRRGRYERGSRHRGRDNDRDRNRDRDRSDRYDRSDRSERSERRRGSESERSLHTPRGRDEPRTPRSGGGGRSDTSGASWDDDDDRQSSSRRSTWDMPTPRRDERNRSDSSIRSNSSKYRSSKYADDTPRPTPAHKFNAWANDRKRTGATPHIGE